METQKQCIACQKTVRGRSDKKFCNDYCRNSYNNQLKSPANTLIRNQNNQLLKNRKILETIYGKEKIFIKINNSELLKMGFDFDLVTQVRKTKQQSLYYYCYEFGYMPINNDTIVIIGNESP